MKRFYRNIREITILLASSWFLLLLLSVVEPRDGEATGVNTASYLYPLDSRPSGVSYTNATEYFHSLMYKEKKDENFVTDTTGKYCALNQNALVWYLAGTPGGSVTRTCTVPAGEPLFFPLIANECSYAENPNLNSAAQLTDCAKSANTNILVLKLSIDGVDLQDLAKFRVTTPPFKFVFGQDNIAGVPPGPTTGVADGIFGFIKPLPPGNHTLEFGGSAQEGNSAFTVDAIYHLTVK